MNFKRTNKNPSGNSRGIFYFRIVLLVFIFFLSVIGFSQPKIEISEPKKNFGHVQRGKKVVLYYDILNSGNAPLLLLEAEVSCSCTNVVFTKEPIAPGKSTRVQVSFETKSVYGRQDRVVFLKNNDPKGVAELHYKGHVSKRLETPD